MENISLIVNIFLGVTAGVITYAVIGIGDKIFREMIIPWYQTKIYRGHSIIGEWYGYSATVDDTGEYTQDTESDSTIILKQQGNKIYGERLLTMQPTGEKCRKLFDIQGSFVDTILVVNSKVKDSNSMGTGIMIMKLTEEGTRLKGTHTYISSHDWSTVVARSQIWVRKN